MHWRRAELFQKQWRKQISGMERQAGDGKRREMT
jgi:hypothetical protein